LAENGCRVILTGRRQPRLAEVVEGIKSKNGEAIQFTVDVSDETQVRNVAVKAWAEWNRLDILINAAGIMLLNPVMNANTEEWRQMISVPS
jgi:NADP-dependent 3-hydroxy acid dehydrogenase YdfG